MTRQEYKQLTPEQRKQVKQDQLIAAACIIPSVLLILFTIIFKA